MVFSTTSQAVEKPVAPQPATVIPDAVLSMLILSMYGAQVSKKTLRKLKRKFFWTALKLKARSVFHPRDFSDRQLLYIIGGVAFIILLFVNLTAALVLALIALLLILTGVI